MESYRLVVIYTVVLIGRSRPATTVISRCSEKMKTDSERSSFEDPAPGSARSARARRRRAAAAGVGRSPSGRAARRVRPAARRETGLAAPRQVDPGAGDDGRRRPGGQSGRRADRAGRPGRRAGAAGHTGRGLARRRLGAVGQGGAARRGQPGAGRCADRHRGHRLPGARVPGTRGGLAGRLGAGGADGDDGPDDELRLEQRIGRDRHADGGADRAPGSACRPSPMCWPCCSAATCAT